MLELKKISVISIVNKGTRFYLTALKSFLYQTYLNTEWILIDNTGRNIIAPKIAQYLEKYPKIKLVSNETILSYKDVLKEAFENATGEYVAFLNPQDYWVKDKLARQIGFMMRYNAPLSHTGYAFGDDRANLIPIGCSYVQKEINYLNYNLKNPISISTLMLNKERTSLNLNKIDNEEHKDLMLFMLHSGLVSSGICEVMSLSRPIFDKETKDKIEALIKKVRQENPKDKSIVLRVLEYNAYKASNIAELKLEPIICIGHDVIESLARLREFKI